MLGIHPLTKPRVKQWLLLSALPLFITGGWVDFVSVSGRNECSLILVGASERCLWNGTKKTVSSERLNRDRLAITVYCPLNTNILCLFKCSNVFWLTQVHDISPFIFRRKTTFGIIVINCIMLHSVTESVDFDTKQWKTKKNAQNSKRSWRLIEADFNRLEKKRKLQQAFC